jgi:hypothetical protein
MDSRNPLPPRQGGWLTLGPTVPGGPGDSRRAKQADFSAFSPESPAVEPGPSPAGIHLTDSFTIRRFQELENRLI